MEGIDCTTTGRWACIGGCIGGRVAGCGLAGGDSTPCQDNEHVALLVHSREIYQLNDQIMDELLWTLS